MKNMLILCFSLTVATLCANTKEELLTVLIEKEQLLTALGKEIEAQEALIRSIKVRMYQVCNTCIEYESQLNASPTQKQELNNSIYSECAEFHRAYLQAIDHNEHYQQLLLEHYRSDQKKYGHMFRGLLKFYCLREAYESSLLEKLIGQWELLFAEVHILKKALAGL